MFLVKDLKPEKKRIFISLLGLSSIFIVLLLLIFWYISHKGISSVSIIAAILFTLIIGGFAMFLALSTVIIVIAMVSRKQSKVSSKMRSVVTRFLFPVVVRVAKILRIDKEKIVRSFIAVNNELVMESILQKKIDRPLVLLPHCIQLEECELKITKDIFVCKKCGKCDIKDLANIAEKYKLKMCVATGGTIARRIVKEVKPDLIVAVACERDLLSGIQDTYPIPVIGILNKRPNGDCINTKVDIKPIWELFEKIQGIK